MTAPDIILPLSRESVDGRNDELRIFLRSLEANGRGFGEIWLVTDAPPSWLVEIPDNGLRVIWAEDTYKSNKDANLFCKVRLALSHVRSDCVIFTADDCAILHPVDFSTLPPIVNSRTIVHFRADPEQTKWKRRMIATLEELSALEHFGNYDTHCPQRWPTERTAALLGEIPYTSREGRCICTAIMGRIFGARPLAPGRQGIWKETVAGHADPVHDISDARTAKLDRTFVGYDDAAFRAGLRERLFERFAERSRWER